MGRPTSWDIGGPADTYPQLKETRFDRYESGDQHQTKMQLLRCAYDNRWGVVLLEMS